ncbi:MAG: glycosyltransferase [Solirubrobacterales bacterium]
MTGEAPTDERADGELHRVLFATSNGTGLGHLNRSMAIARRLGKGVEASFFTLSQAAPLVAREGYRVDYHPSYRRPGSGSDWQWNRRLRERLERTLAARPPDLVVFDGVHPYRALTHLLTESGAPPAVWCRRPLWRPESPAAALGRTAAFDWVLEPGELAEELDRGPTVARREEAIRVPPIVLLDEGELLPREGAAAELGLDPGPTTALVNLGQGASVDAAVERVLATLSARGDLQVAVLSSSIGSGVELPPGVVPLEATFPMSRYFRAFDLAVSAAGYNAFHELVAFAVPSLFVPMPRQTDDQPARASWAERVGAGVGVAGPADTELGGGLQRLLDEGERERMVDRCREQFAGGGAERAAGEIRRILEGNPSRSPLADPDPLRRWLRMSAHPVGPTLPLAAALTARDLIRHPERRRPRALVLAFELDPGTVDRQLRAVLERTAAPPDRVLVLTDHADLVPFRQRGLGIHRAPAAGEVGLAGDDAAYAEVLAEVVDAALAPWRGSWPVYGIGQWFEREAGPIPGRAAEFEVDSRPLELPS